MMFSQRWRKEHVYFYVHLLGLLDDFVYKAVHVVSYFFDILIN